MGVVHLAQSISLVAVLLFGALPVFSLSPPWQHHGAAASQPSAQPPLPQSGGSAPLTSGGAYTFRPQGPGPHRGDWLRKYMMLPPQQQEQQLRHDFGFQSLPPERQNHLLQRLREFNHRSPEQKAQILNRMETFEHMSPQQQQQARDLFSQYHSLPADQRSKVSQAYQRLRGMSPSARNDLLNSDDFRNNYTQQQRDLLRGMTDLNVGPTR
jgi:hypothetical protein